MSSKAEAEARRYLQAQGLERDINLKADFKPGVFDHVAGTMTSPIPPEVVDLARLHGLIRSRRCFTVLEFGVGYSTIIIADALEKNQKDWQGLARRPDIRNRFMFQLFTVDTSRKWLAESKRRLPHRLQGRVHFQYSAVKIGTCDGQLCHYYRALPDIVPDFIYLDGPDPKEVQGRINGLSFQCDERTVMSADLLLMEPSLLPGTFILVDGRTNNARFLQRSFKRKFAARWDPQGDVTTFELTEKRLGPHNLLGSDFFRSAARGKR